MTQQTTRAALAQALDALESLVFNTPYDGKYGDALAAVDAKLAKAGGQGDVVRYCRECGSIGEVPKGKRDCCPDGTRATYVHPAIAEQAKGGFHAALPAHPQASEPAPSTAGEQGERAELLRAVRDDSMSTDQRATIYALLEAHPKLEPLEDAEIPQIARMSGCSILPTVEPYYQFSPQQLLDFTRAIEAAHKIGGHG